ncbi:MAG: hypothetical protein Q4B71_02215 [Cardiobacteriaceae bacterium]|nr:hypothetical protein [Cardiobacteriaceae bacterium]
MARRETVSLHWAWQLPFKALCALLVAVGLSLFDDYLGQSQEYLMNYQLLMHFLIVMGALVLATHVLVYPFVNKVLILEIVFLISLFHIIDYTMDFFANWWGFRYEPLPKYLVSMVAVVWFVWQLRLLLKRYVSHQSALGKALWLGMLPVVMMAVYGYLAHHNFFAQRAGSYPEYHTMLYQQQGKQGQPIKQFFRLTE